MRLREAIAWSPLQDERLCGLRDDDDGDDDDDEDDDALMNQTMTKRSNDDDEEKLDHSQCQRGQRGQMMMKN